MLILSRKAGESLVVGEGIRITVTRVRGDRVQLGIEAPAAVPVVRAELLDGPLPPPEEPQGVPTGEPGPPNPHPRGAAASVAAETALPPATWPTSAIVTPAPGWSSAGDGVFG